MGELAIFLLNGFQLSVIELKVITYNTLSQITPKVNHKINQSELELNAETLRQVHENVRTSRESHEIFSVLFLPITERNKKINANARERFC